VGSHPRGDDHLPPGDSPVETNQAHSLSAARVMVAITAAVMGTSSRQKVSAALLDGHPFLFVLRQQGRESKLAVAKRIAGVHEAC
jgi:hypothetical protein